MLGIEIAVNFNSPYQAVNIVDFWKRWQITLNRYVHPSIALKRQQMNKLSSIYGQFVGQSER